VILVMTHGPGTLTGRMPVTVSTFPPGSVTVKVLAFTCRAYRTWRRGTICPS